MASSADSVVVVIDQTPSYEANSESIKKPNVNAQNGQNSTESLSHLLQSNHHSLNGNSAVEKYHHSCKNEQVTSEANTQSMIASEKRERRSLQELHDVEDIDASAGASKDATNAVHEFKNSSGSDQAQQKRHAKTTGIVMKLLLVAAGAIAGVLLRYALALGIPNSYVLATFTANVLAVCIMGGAHAALGWMETARAFPHVRLFLVTGMLGSLSTVATYTINCIEIIQIYGWANVWTVILLIIITNVACLLVLASTFFVVHFFKSSLKRPTSIQLQVETTIILYYWMCATLVITFSMISCAQDLDLLRQ